MGAIGPLPDSPFAKHPAGGLKTGARRRRPNGRAAVGMRRHADALPCRVFMPLVPTDGGAYRAARARHPAFMPWQWRRNRPGAFLLAGRPPHELAKMA